MHPDERLAVLDAEPDVDIVLMDIGLPGGDGLAAARNLQEKVFTRFVPIIFITASRKEGLLDEAKQIGASAYLEKPFKASQLLPAINSALIEAAAH